MSTTRSSQAIVLRTRPYGDIDAIVRFLTRDAGKLAGIAKGAKNSRRRFGNCLDAFTRVQVHFRLRQGATLAFLERCELLHASSGMAQPNRFAYGSYLVELVDALTREADPVPEIYDLLDGTLHAIETGQATAALLRTFELRLLRDLGFGSPMDCCTRCGRQFDDTEQALLDGEHGLFLCRHCSGADRSMGSYDATMLAVLSRLQQMPLPQCAEVRLTPEHARQAAGLTGRLLGLHLTRPLKSIELIAALSAEAV